MGRRKLKKGGDDSELIAIMRQAREAAAAEEAKRAAAAEKKSKEPENSWEIRLKELKEEAMLLKAAARRKTASRSTLSIRKMAPVAPPPAVSRTTRRTTGPVAEALITTGPVAEALITTGPVAEALITEAPVAEALITTAPVAEATRTTAPVAEARRTTGPVAEAHITTVEEEEAAETTFLDNEPHSESEKRLTKRMPSKKPREAPTLRRRELPSIIEGGTRASAYNRLTVKELKAAIQANPVARGYLKESSVAQPRKAHLVVALEYADSVKPKPHRRQRK